MYICLFFDFLIIDYMKNRTRKYSLNTQAPAPHTGEMLANYITTKRIYQSALARLLNRNQSSIAVFRKGSTMQTAILWEFCHALKYNFFADIAAQLPTEYGSAGNSIVAKQHDNELDSLKSEITSLKMERDILKAMLETWVKKS